MNADAPTSMWTLPNVLTVSRLVAAPVVLLVFAALPRPTADWAALILFIAAAVTDWLDGRIARARQVETAVGRMLDPIADKVMSMTALALLLGIYGLEPALLAPVALIFLREIAVAGLREFLAGAKILSVTVLAKWKTTAQLAAIALLLAVAPLESLAPGWGDAFLWPLGMAALWLAAALTVITGWDYFSKGLAHIRDREG